MQKMENSHDKWSQPGWRIEQKYSNKVLIGNWVEEKLQFARECKTANSTNRLDYTPHMLHRPDVAMRRKALHRSEGVPTRLLLSHHDVPSSHYLVSLYDESYGRQASSSLPTLRSWHSDKLAWVPERSDHPVQGPPTKFGLAESWRAHMQQQRAVVPTLSVYKASYPLHPISTFCHSRHVSMPKRLSSSQHPANHSNRDLALKHRPCRQVSSNPARLL
ncbi:cilia- and flagella-associated protein 107 [Rhinichthys klamathensis goyatoka]|uniref:cilia- and flagella-associated protein 107 n=1 Tax=Rhinichthys klamathensis goyatoka TaxID=3034132 RepID=UPI0024B5CEFF|nr:cilia- and flagella-associated protein 107 [Rhinichthys klamathensis goyatoka]